MRRCRLPTAIPFTAEVTRGPLPLVILRARRLLLILWGMRRSRSAVLSARLALASLGTAVAVGVVCAVGLSSLGNASAAARAAVVGQLALVDEASAMTAFLYQK